MDRLSLPHFAKMNLGSSSDFGNASYPSASCGRSSAGSRAGLLSRSVRRISDQSASRVSRELSLFDVNPVVGVTAKTLRGFLQGFTTLEKLCDQLESLEKIQQNGLLDSDDRQMLAMHLQLVAKEEHQNVHQLPGLQPAFQKIVDAFIANVSSPRSPNSINRPSTAGRAHSNMLGGVLLSPEQLATRLGLPLARKSEGRSDGNSSLAHNRDEKNDRVKWPSYLVSDSIPGKTWRVSPAFRHGGFKKIRLSLDNDDKMGIFTVQYIEDATRFPPRSQKAMSLRHFLTAEQMLLSSASPLALVDGAEHAFVDQKGRVWNWRPFFKLDLHDMSEGFRRTAPTFDRAFLQLMLNAAEDVARIHDRKLMLLDIKAANFLYDNSYGVVFGDFDFTRSSEAMMLDEECGTRGYMAPEMVDREGRKIGQAADIFSLGQTFVQMITGTVLKAFSFENPDSVRWGYHQMARFNLEARVESAEDPGDQIGSLHYTYGKLFAVNEWLGQFVFNDMLNWDPALRPSAKDVVATLKKMVPEAQVEYEEQISQMAEVLDAELANVPTEILLSRLKARPALPSSDEAQDE